MLRGERCGSGNWWKVLWWFWLLHLNASIVCWSPILNASLGPWKYTLLSVIMRVGFLMKINADQCGIKAHNATSRDIKTDTLKQVQGSIYIVMKAWILPFRYCVSNFLCHWQHIGGNIDEVLCVSVVGKGMHRITGLEGRFSPVLYLWICCFFPCFPLLNLLPVASFSNLSRSLRNLILTYEGLLLLPVLHCLQIGSHAPFSCDHTINKNVKWY